MPRLLGKDFTKVDFPKLRADMNKWYETMPTSAVESWKEYLQTKTNLLMAIVQHAPYIFLKQHVEDP